MKRILVLIIALGLLFCLFSCADTKQTPIEDTTPVTDEPVADEPVADEPVADELVADEPVADEPVADEPVADEPVADEPVADEPVADEPVADKPVADKPVADDPVVEKNVFWEYPFKNVNEDDFLTLAESDYTGLEYTKIDTSATDADITANINDLLEGFATYEDVERAAGNGDTVVIDFTGSIGGEKFAGGSAADQTLVLGEGGYIDGFEDGILGHTAGETFTINVTFPESYGVEGLDGKEAQFEIVLKSVKEKHVPEFTNEFIAENTIFSDAVEYTTQLVIEIQKVKEKNAETTYKNNILEHLLTSVEIKDTPKPMYDFFHGLFMEIYEAAAKDEGLSLSEFLMQLGATEADLQAYADEYAKESSSLELILYAVAKKENISLDLTREEYDRQIAIYAEEFDATPAELEDYYSKEELCLTFVHNNVMDHILSLSIAK